MSNYKPLKKPIINFIKNNINNLNDENKKISSISLLMLSGLVFKEYYIYYRWRKKDVKKIGRYQAMFSIFLHDECSEIKVPIREDLFINITDSFVSASCVC